MSLCPVFLTGCDRVPFLGMGSIVMRVTVLPNSSELHLPEAFTCHYLLLLPNYQRYPVERTMQTRLLEAIRYKGGFHKKEVTRGWRNYGVLLSFSHCTLLLLYINSNIIMKGVNMDLFSSIIFITYHKYPVCIILFFLVLLVMVDDTCTC